MFLRIDKSNSQMQMYDNLLIVLSNLYTLLFLLPCQQTNNHDCDARKRECEHDWVDEFHHTVGDEHIGAKQSLADAESCGFFSVNEQQQQNDIGRQQTLRHDRQGKRAWGRDRDQPGQRFRIQEKCGPHVAPLHRDHQAGTCRPG